MSSLKMNNRGNPVGWDTRDEMILSRLAAWEPEAQLSEKLTYREQGKLRESVILQVFGRDNDPEFDLWLMDRLYGKRGEA